MTQPGAPVSESSGSPTGAPSVPLIELNGLTVRFGNRDILRGLTAARYRQLGPYSLGMKQLAKLAQAIVHGPKLLILDEPTNGLDPSARQRMVRMVREIRDSREMRIVLCSHLLRDVEDTCDEVL